MPTPPRVAAAVLLVAALLAALAGAARGAYTHNPLDPRLDWYKPYDFIRFNAATDNYGKLMTDIYAVVIRGSSNNVLAQKVRVLHRQNVNRKPFRWLILELLSGSGDNMMLAIRQDNLYITGFTDGDGNWFIFRNRPRWLIPVATVFRLADDYTELVDGYRSLQHVRLGKQTTVDAIKRVATFVPREPADVGCVSRALGIMAVTFAEASRFFPVDELIHDRWESGADLGVPHELVVIVKWRAISCALMISEQEHGTWNSLEAKDLRGSTEIHNIYDALHVLKVAIWPWNERCSETITILK